MFNGSSAIDTTLHPVDARGVLMEYIRNPDFKRLLNQIILSQTKHHFRSLALLSYFPSEGKTLLGATIALAYAEFLKKRVLVIDTVSPTKDDSFYFGRVLGDNWAISASPAGDSGVDLMTRRAISRQIQYNQKHLYPELPNGALYADGPPDRSTMDFHIRYLLDSLRAQYDLILLDTCAMANSQKEDIDPVILAKQAESAVFVTSRSSLERKIILRVKRELESAEVTLLGVLFNPAITLT